MCFAAKCEITDASMNPDVMIDIVRQDCSKSAVSFQVRGWGTNLPMYLLQVLQCFFEERDVTL